MNGNKLALNKYAHDHYVADNPNSPSYYVKKFTDEISDFDAAANAKFSHNSFQYPPKSSPSAVWTGSEQILDFTISSNQVICHYDSINLRLIATNTGAGIATMLASHFLVDYIEVMIGGSTVETVYAHHLLFNELYGAPSDEQIANNRAVRFFAGGIQGTTYTSGGTIAVGASRTFYINVPCMFSKAELFMPAIQHEITFRVHFVPTPLTTASAATTVALTEASIYVSGRQYDDATKQKLIARYKSIDHVAPYYLPERTLISSVAMVNTAKTQLQLTSFGGYLSSQVVVYLTPSASVQENLYNFAALTKLDIFRGGVCISSFTDVYADWWKQQMANLYKTTSVYTQNIYAIPQSVFPVESYNLGLQRGGVFLTNNDALEIQPVTSATYDVRALCYRFAVITITKDGQLTVNQVTGQGV